MSRIRRKGISARIAAVFLSIILIIIVGAYFIGTMKEESPLSRLGIIPEKILHPAETTIPVKCYSNEDCPKQTKCEINLYYYMIGSCGNDNRCSYDNWTIGNCTQSKQYCEAECDVPGDCRSHICLDDCTCKP